MLSHSVDEVSDATLVGGEMRAWSDRADGSVDVAVAQLVGRLIARLSTPGSAVLLVGPRATALLDAVPLPVGIAVTAAARSLDDVREAALRHPAVTWVAGSVDRVAASSDDRFDLVVALGGARDLLSPDSKGLGVEGLVALLAGRLSPTGQLVVDLENGLGLQRFTDLEEPAHLVDADFVVGMPGTDERGRWSHEVDPIAASAGFGVTTRYAAWPTLRSPAVLVSAEGLAHPATRALAARAAQLAVRPAPALVDRRTSIRDVFDARQAMELAPGWLLVLGQDATRGADLPTCLWAETWAPTAMSRVVIVDGAGSVETTPPTNAAAITVQGATVTRDAQAPTPGTTLESAVGRALQRGATDAARALLSAWSSWLSDEGSWRERGPARFSAVAPNVVVSEAEGTLALLDASWHVDDAALSEPDVVLLTALLQLSQRLVDGAAETPFGPGLSVDEMASELVVLAGRDLSHVDAASVTRLRAVLAEIGFAAVSLTAPESSGAGVGRGTHAAYHDLHGAHERALAALDEERGRARWLEGTLRARDREVRTLERAIDVESSRAYKAMRQAARPVPALRRAARRALTWVQSRRR